MELKKILGQRIKELRIKYNLKQSELAEKVNIATKTQSCIETGKNFPSSELIERYATAFEIDICELLNIKQIKNRETLIENITKALNKANDEDLKLIYRIISDIIY